MRVALIAESSLIHMNGVTHSLLQVLRHLRANGHETLVIAPRAGDDDPGSEQLHGAELSLLRSVPLPSYPEVRLVFARARALSAILREFTPDVVHLASPFVLGWQGLRAAELLGIPTVAIYQTDIPGYAQRYGMPVATQALAQHVARIHRRATLTLAPSSSAIAELSDAGVDRLRHWARGVDAERFHPGRRDEALRRRLAPDGEVIIGYVGRLAPEKQVEDLRAIAALPGTRLVIVGDGPSRPALERLLPGAAFLGFLGGDGLAEAVASFDLFVHPGENETFCQTVQEALASGVPTVAVGRGGPLDLVQNSRTGWLYRPGDLDDLRARVLDLVGDAGKRRAFSIAARESVANRSWARLGDELIGHYRDAIRMRRAGVDRRDTAPAQVADRPLRPRLVPNAAPGAVAGWTRYVAVGDSITEGLGDSSRQAPGQFRGWADRLAMLLAHQEGRTSPLLSANLAVRSRTVSDVLNRQIPRALELKADLVSVLVGGNDLARHGADPQALAASLATGIARVRESGAEVLLVTPFIPPWPMLRLLHERTAAMSRALRQVAVDTDSRLLDLSIDPDRLDERMWADDRVHLSSHGHRLLSYRAAETLGVPGVAELGALDRALHHDEADEPGCRISTPAWVWLHVRPWAGRRLRGRTAGDGLEPKRPLLLPVLPVDPSGHPAPAEP
ncbi:GDSL-type esterase/lipase family protein [Lysinimonas soli]|uniref:D-inositol 3-phosphate glycosyltransferase n=1 Tax=Lysinimonas soli TaxID=1074233 RepID=A0ABW0NNJ7_9MICO